MAIFCFGDHELDEGRFELRRAGHAVEVQPKALELLLHLVRHRERVVSKRELLGAVWPDAVVTAGSLARAVSLARAAIGDRGARPRAIVTVPRRGYRFEAPVREAEGPDPARRAPVAPAAPRASAYVGRAGLVARLAERLDAALAGSGCVLLLAGEAGIGKTRTAELLMQRARRAGAAVAVALGPEEGAPALSGWTRLLRTLAAEPSNALAAEPSNALATEPSNALAALGAAQRLALARLLPELAPPGPEPAPAVGGEAALRFALFDAVQGFLAAAARSRPLALLLDDLHAADAESIALLEHVGQAIAPERIVVVATCRDEEGGRTPRQTRALERVLRLTALERWPLAGLAREEVAELVHTRLGREAEPGLVDALVHQTGGNPLLIGEGLRSLEARGLLGAPRAAREWEALLPRGIRHLLLPKLRGLSAPAREALGIAAALGGEAERRLLERCLPDPAPLAELEATGLLLPAGAALRFSHALVREALYAELAPPGEARRALHARIFEALMPAPGAAEPDAALFERAHHACEAAPLVPAARAIELAREAGARDALRLDFESACVWYGRATALLGDAAEPALRAELLLGLADATTRAFGLERARPGYREAADHARAVGRGDLLAAAALGFAHRPSSSGEGDAETIRLLEDAVRCAPVDDEPLRIRVLSRLAVELRYADPERAEALAEESIHGARRLGDARALTQTLDDASYVRWSPADSEGWVALNAEVVEAARACGDLELVLNGQRGVVTGRLELGDLAGVEREVRACMRTAEALRTPQARWYVAALHGMGALLAGDLEAAERHVGETGALGERIESREVALEAGIQLVALRLEQGRAGEVEAAVRAQVQQFPGNAGWRAALARLQLSAGLAAEAREELERLARRRFADVPRDRGWLPTLAMAAELAFAARDTEAAESIASLLAPFARLHVVAGSGLLYYGSVEHALGLAAATGAHFDAAVAHFEAALAGEEAAGAKLWAARTRVECARALVARGVASDRPRAAKLVGDALASARRRGWRDVEAAGRDLEASLWSRRRNPGRRPAARGSRGTEG